MLEKYVKHLKPLIPELRESEDERIRKIITDSVFYQYGADKEYEDVLDYLDKLKKQKEQKPAEWSEEDERKKVELKTFIAQCNGFNKENRKKAFDMIDAIHPSWKPNKKQMGALSWMLENARGNIDFDPLKDLYEQLKKLM